jgi:hypothetical protein
VFRFVEVRPYEARRGHRFTFQGGRGRLPPWGRWPDGLRPKGKRVEVSLIDLSPCPGGLEAAVIYGGAFIAFHRGLTLTAEEALSETLLQA